MKVVKSSYLSPFAGLNFVLEELDKLKIGHKLNEHLPRLSNQCQYDWRDIFYSFWSVFFCGGDCIEDLSDNLSSSLKEIPYLNTPSPDTVLRRMKELADKKELFDTPRGTKRHEFSINTLLNRLNVKLIKERVLKTQSPIVIDYDNTLLYNNKKDAKQTYQKQFGYAPGVGIINDNIVYLENRNGNSDAQTLQQETLQRMFDLLKDEGIKADIFRADGASYQLSTLSVISENVNKLFIKARMSQQLQKAIQSIDSWEEVTIDDQICYRGSTEFVPFEATAKRNKQEHFLKSYRLVVTKESRRDGQINLFTNESCNYHAIITNDRGLSNDEVVFFYNQRGAIEKEFDILKNDFGWHNLPFSKLEQNTVFLIFSAICRNLYAHIIEIFSERFKGLSPTFRIKKFIFRFISIPGKWIKQSRTWKLRIYGQVAYKT